MVETCLGYFITPLLSVLLGVLIFGERLRRAQWAAVGLGAVAVLVIAVIRTPAVDRTDARAVVRALRPLQEEGGRGGVESMAIETGVMVHPGGRTDGAGAHGSLTFADHGAGQRG